MSDKNTENKKRAVAKLNYLHISPRKVRLVADIIRSLPVQEAEAQLLFSPKRASKHFSKLLHSAIVTAENDHKMNPHNLYIKEVRVDQGPVLKRWMPRARGSINEIRKKMSHITLILEETEKPVKERFIITKKPKEKAKSEEKKGKREKKDQPKVKPEQETEKPKERKSPLQKFFRRKSI